MPTHASEMQRHIARLLLDLGYDMTFRREVRGAYDPATSQATPGTPDDETCRAVFVENAQQDGDNDNVIRGDRFGFIAELRQGTALTKEPKPGDLLIGLDEEVQIIDARKVQARNFVSAFKVQVRGR